MNNLFVNCNNCGTSLQIDEEIAFVTCRNCHASLEVMRTFNSVYTKVNQMERLEIFDKSEQSKKPIYKLKEVDTTEIYKRIELLDKDWKNQLPTFMAKGKLPSESNKGTIIISIAAILLTVCAIVFFVFSGNGFFGFLGFLGLITLVIIMVVLFEMIDKQEKYKKAKAKYEENRLKLLASLNQ